MEANHHETTAQAYLEAFDQRDLPRCLEFFTDDAQIHFAMGVFRGLAAVEDWHKKRFEAEMKVLRVEQARSNGDAVILDVIATSKVARAWKFPSIAGTVKFEFDQGKITLAKFHLRTPIPVEGWS